MTAYTELNMNELDSLIKRLEEAEENHFVLEPGDIRLVISALITLAEFQHNLNSKDVTIGKLKKLAGLVKSSEKLQHLASETASTRSKKPPKKKNKPTSTPVKPASVIHSLADYKKGDTCPECERGTLYKYAPATFLRIVGQTPYVPEQHVLERLRCNACGQYFTAEVNDEVKADGDSHQKYAYSARSLIALSKYYLGTPFYRQGSLQNILGVPLCASTQFDQMEYLVNDIGPVFNYLKSLAADADFYWIDDTTHRILDKKCIEKVTKKGQKVMRKGVYASGMIALLQSQQRIVLFETNIGHAGEFFESIYRNRSATAGIAVLMSDALSSNQPMDKRVIHTLCNAHARRYFHDILSHFTDEVDHVLEQYSHIWRFDSKTEKMTIKERQIYHQQHSFPVMEGILGWCLSKLESGEVEENSGLGKAMNYFIKHYEGLTQFCHIPGAQIDNNCMEAEIKLIVRDRKNGLFRKTLFGACVGDIITSMIATSSWCGANIFEYFNLLQRDKLKVKTHPELYLPWNYQTQR